MQSGGVVADSGMGWSGGGGSSVQHLHAARSVSGKLLQCSETAGFVGSGLIFVRGCRPAPQASITGSPAGAAVQSVHGVQHSADL